MGSGSGIEGGIEDGFGGEVDDASHMNADKERI